MALFKLEMASLSRAAAFGVLLLGAQCAAAAPVLYDFEAFNDSEALTNQISGLSFGQATVLAAGLSLNEIEFPPHSGSKVVFDDGGPLSISFAAPVFSVGGFFNYLTALNFSAYDSGDNLLGSLTSLFASNLGLSGDPGSSSNEFLSFDSSAGLISKVVISGDALGASFTLDDLSVDAGLTVPEPQSLALVLAACAAASLRCRRTP